MQMRSIGARLTFWYTGILCVTLLMLGILEYGLLTYSLSRDIDAALHGVAQAIADQARKSGRTPIPPDLDELFRRFFGFSPATPYFEMLTPWGHPGSVPPSPPPLGISPQALKNALHGLSTFETLKDSEPYPVRMLIMPVMIDGQVTNVVQVGISLENMYNTLRRFVLIMAALFPLGLILAGGGGWLLARRALRPVDHMTRAAQRISGEHLTERLHETGTGDELDRLARTLNEMLTRLDESFRQVRQFSADASHELQTPLTILKGEIEVALRASRSPEEYQQVLKSSLEEIERISRLVEGLLLLARADSGVLRMDHKPVALDELVAEVAAQMQNMAKGQGLSLHLGNLAPITINGDREQLQRLLINLIDNAIKYTPAGGSVSLALSKEGDQATVSVADTGIGLSPDEQTHIFTRFYRVAAARSQSGGGVGLGLCIAQSIAQAHGGKIEVRSQPGRGSTFTVVLPLVG
jgi:heavy metal sensor kinase|uniref:histidine kinase n=1 Tax=Desulfobacca acetoxidans TaxID=60893 RepID=A0A7V6DQU8_9BACT